MRFWCNCRGWPRHSGPASLLLVAFYPLAKRVTWWPQLVMGFTFGFGAPLGYAAAAARLDGAWAAIYAAAVLWDLGFDTIYAHQDREDDALVGVKSTARLWSEHTRPFLAACFAGTAPWRSPAGSPAFRLWFFPALLLPAALFARQVATLDIETTNRSPRGCSSGTSARPGWPLPQRCSSDDFDAERSGKARRRG